LAAIAGRNCTGRYAATADIQDRVALLRGYLQRGADTVSLFNRMMALWASAGIQSMLTKEQRQSIVDTRVRQAAERRRMEHVHARTMDPVRPHTGRCRE
jgi:hypothetical protein